MNEQLQKQFDQVFGTPDKPTPKPHDTDAERAAMRRLEALELIAEYNQQKGR